MKERPIIFQGWKIPKIMDGSATMTRRLLKPQPFMVTPGETPMGAKFMAWYKGGKCTDLFCPYGSPGDQLWVRETWTKIEGCQGPESMPSYRADGELSFEDGSPVKWKPSILMPRWASRIILEIMNIKVERVQEITEEDANREGADWYAIENKLCNIGRCQQAFHRLWNSIHGKGAWDRNDWVFVIEFKRIKPWGETQNDRSIIE